MRTPGHEAADTAPLTRLLRKVVALALPLVLPVVLLATASACGHAPATRSARPARPARTAVRDPNSADTTQLRAQSAGRVEELFAGRFPGVQAYAVPGGFVVRVRGATTLRGTADPLYIIDGQPILVGPDGLVALNPADVARIEVLKDAAELAAYGSRAGNGVVRITTKRPPHR